MNARSSRRPGKPADSVARYMGAHDREVARERVDAAMAMGSATLAFAARVRDAVESAGIALVRAVTLS